MKLSELRDFFDGEISDADFHTIIQQEVLEYERRQRAKRSSNPITVINDTEIIVAPRMIARLCSSYLRGAISDTDLAYVADALLLSNFAQNVAFLGEDLSDLVALLTDPEINGPITKERVEDILNDLQSNENL